MPISNVSARPWHLLTLAQQALRLHTGMLGTGQSIADCASIAVAHTGSTFLFEQLRPLSIFATHNHDVDIATLYAQGIRCFVLTLRDPA